MARTGRKRKQGRRTDSGQLSRAGVSPYDHGTERAQAMQVLYGQDGCDALGRAFRSRLLGPRDKELLYIGRAISNAYWQAYETGRYACTLGGRTSGSVVDINHEKVKRREIWLSDSLDKVKAISEPVRKAFYQLVIDVNPDHGPDWLDRLCYAKRCGHECDERDTRSLDNAIKGLTALCA